MFQKDESIIYKVTEPLFAYHHLFWGDSLLKQGQKQWTQQWQSVFSNIILTEMSLFWPTFCTGAPTTNRYIWLSSSISLETTPTWSHERIISWWSLWPTEVKISEIGEGADGGVWVLTVYTLSHCGWTVTIRTCDLFSVTDNYSGRLGTSHGICNVAYSPKKFYIWRNCR